MIAGGRFIEPLNRLVVEAVESEFQALDIRVEHHRVVLGHLRGIVAEEELSDFAMLAEVLPAPHY